MRPKAKSDSYHHGDLKKTLLDAALRILKKRSPESLSLRELAREAGVSQAAPYRHFKNKEELLAALCEQGFELKMKFMKEAMDRAGDDTLEMFYSCGVSYFRMGLKHPQHFKLMFSAGIIPNEKYPKLRQVAAQTFALLSDMVRRCQKEGILGAGDPFHKAMHCWFVVNGFTSLYAEGRLEWLGIHKDNAEAAMRLFLNQYLLGAKTPLTPGKEEFSPFNTPDSAFHRELLQSLQNISTKV